LPAAHWVSGSAGSFRGAGAWLLEAVAGNGSCVVCLQQAQEAHHEGDGLVV
jgi:hypothetical protein